MAPAGKKDLARDRALTAERELDELFAADRDRLN
jgi:hypothetical protein